MRRIIKEKVKGKDLEGKKDVRKDDKMKAKVPKFYRQ